ncbi:MAG: hypothetical protein COV44_04750 [Deltaproteobacteria bacterium CG11_big_fil_rev_8_21_14_0_20_45_16]|nr:MAG: hypothetical protein COV44_04750 [Deltaproteobacteria bacterium CG11_big_fil_rev_8_21_14_0_20_45_16]
MFLPAAGYVVLRRNELWGSVLLLASALLACQVLSERSGLGLDILSLVLFFSAAPILYFGRKAKHWGTEKLLYGYVGLGLLAFLGLSLGHWAHGSIMNWFNTEMNADLVKSFFGMDQWPADLRTRLEKIIFPFVRLTLVAWFGVMLASIFLFNAFLLRLSSRRNPLKFWVHFSSWRPKDWVLIVVVIGLGILAASPGPLIPDTIELLPWLGWNLAILGSFPIVLGGLSFLSYMTPRLPFFLSILVLLVLFSNPPPVLLLTGLADMWFDFRKRWKSQAEQSKDEDDKPWI